METVDKSTGRAIHVGVNAHLLSLAESYRNAGINKYIQNLLQYLPQADPEMAFTVFLGEPRYVGAPGLDLRLSRLPTHHPPARIVWEQALQPWAIRQEGLDLIHNLAYVGSLVSPCPSVVTVHDLSFLHYPQGFRTINLFYLRLFTRLSVRQARRIIADSESTKRDVMRHYGLSPSRVDAVHIGVDTRYQPLPAARVADFRAEQGLPDRFILFVGTLEPRKNIGRLLQPYALLSQERPPLIIVGAKGWLYEQVFALRESLNLDDEVHFVGYVPGEDLPLWYNAADLFVYPSLYEGFGLPPLEAMACGTPVVASNASSLPEVVGEAGLLVDPNDVEALTGAMEQALGDADLRGTMRARGLTQARCFSWEKMAVETADIYRQILEPPYTVEPQTHLADGEGENCV